MMTMIKTTALALILAAGAAGAQTADEANAVDDIMLAEIAIEQALDIVRAQETGDVVSLNRDVVGDAPVFEIDTEGELVSGHYVVDARNGDLLISSSERVLNAETEALFAAALTEEEDAMLAAVGMSEEEIDGLSEAERDLALRAAAAGLGELDELEAFDDADFLCDDE